MRRFLSIITSLSIATFSLFPAIILGQGATGLKDLEVVNPPAEVTVNEGFDLTVRALDNTNKKLTTYEGTIYFATNNEEADVVLPFEDDEYKFTLSDQGEHTFSKGFMFKKPGVYEVVIFELETPGEGISKTVKITAVDKTTPPPVKSDVVITDPGDKTTVSTKNITVSGTSKPTSSINILLNTKKVKTTQTDAEGKFSAEITDLKAGDNVLVAEVLDGNSAVTGTSAPVTIKFSTEVPKLTSLTIKEGAEFFAGESITFIAVGDPGLKSVTIKVGDKTAVLEEDKAKLGTYTGIMKTSEFEGEFSAHATIESQLGVKVEIKDMVKFRTITAKIQNIEVKTTEDKKVRFTFNLDPDLDQIQYFKIKYGTETNNYTKEVVTYSKSDIKEGDKYTWYIPGIAPGEYFSTIIALNKDKKELPVNSGEQTFTVALDAAPTCTIEQVSGVRVDKAGETYSMVRWDNLEEAVSYQIFKKDSTGEFVMIDETKKNEYRINIDMSTEKEVYEDFKIRGICKNGNYTGEGAYSESVAVQTGPEMIILFVLFIASGISFILMRRGYFD